MRLYRRFSRFFMIVSVEELQQQYSDAIGIMFETSHRTRFQTTRSDNGSHHVEIIGNEYHLIATERGLELDRQVTRDADELLYWLVSHVAFWKGVDFEFKNRIEHQDCRRQIFAKQLELIKRVDNSWAERLAGEIDRILEENPYVDR